MHLESSEFQCLAGHPGLYQASKMMQAPGVVAVNIAEGLPTGEGDQNASFEQEEDEGEMVQTADGSSLLSPSQAMEAVTPEQVYVETSGGGLITAEQLAQLPTTHIVIHDQTLSVAEGLKNPNTPLPPPTPATPNSRDKGFKYQWDHQIHQDILPVRCKSSNGELYKTRFGSGGRGRCIKMDNKWYTPSEFEAACGRASSKDWKRSVRYGGRALQCLIEDGILQPHATSCTCAACCDDESVTGPVRLFVPYKRRKRDSGSISIVPAVQKKPRLNSSPSAANLVAMNTSPASSVSSTAQSPNKETVVVSLTPTNQGPQQFQTLQMARTENGDTIQIVSTDQHGNIIATAEPTVLMASVNHHLKPAEPVQPVLDVNETKNWWQLEEMVNNLMQQAQQLKSMIEVCKQQSIQSKEQAFGALKTHYDKEKNEAVNAVRIEAQMALTRALAEERQNREIAVQHALAQARAEMHDKIESVHVVASDEHKVTYGVNWTNAAAQNHIVEGIMDAGDGEESDKDLKGDGC